MKRLSWALAGVLFWAMSFSAGAQDAKAVLQSLSWVEGPQTVSVGSNGTFSIPAGYVFLSSADTRRWLEEVTQNPSSGNEFFFAPSSLSWWAIFQYEATGHVEDDEKIDADALMAGMRENQEEGNKERQKRGFPMLLNLAWKYPPFYDPATKRLEWAISFVSSDTGKEEVNYETRILGRQGVTSATLVVAPEKLPVAVPEFKAAVAGYSFVAGQRYTEFKQGDKVAEYGLAALVAGGAAAALAKTGFLAKYWKILIGAGAALIAGIGSLFRRKDKA